MMNIQALDTLLSTYQVGTATQSGYLKTSTEDNESSQSVGSTVISISAEGLALYNQSKASSEALAAINDVESKDEDSLLGKMSAGVGGVAEDDEDEEDDEDDYTNLTTLSEQEIRALVSEGKISEAQAQVELASRKDEDE